MTIRIRVISNQALQAYKQVQTANAQIAASTKQASNSVTASTAKMGTGYSSMGAKAASAGNMVATAMAKSHAAVNRFASGGLSNLSTATQRFGTTLGSVFNTRMAS